MTKTTALLNGQLARRDLVDSLLEIRGLLDNLNGSLLDHLDRLTAGNKRWQQMLTNLDTLDQIEEALAVAENALVDLEVIGRWEVR